MKKCSHCGRPIQEDNDRCPACGIRTEGVLRQDNPYAVTDACIYGDEVTQKASKGAAYGVPFGVGETIRTAFALWRGALRQLVLISLIPMLLFLILGIILSIAIPAMVMMKSTDDVSWVVLVIIAIVTILGVIPASFASNAGTFLMLDEKQRTGSISFGIWKAFRRGLDYVWKLLGFSLVSLLILHITSLPAIIGVMSESWVLAVVAALTAAPIIVYLVIKFGLSPIIIVIEERQVIEALGISLKLVRGHSWMIFGIGLFAALIVIGAAIVGSIFSFIPILGFLFELAINVLFAPFLSAVGFTIYAGLKDISQQYAGTGSDAPFEGIIGVA